MMYLEHKAENIQQEFKELMTLVEDEYAKQLDIKNFDEDDARACIALAKVIQLLEDFVDYQLAEAQKLDRIDSQLEAIRVSLDKK